MADRTLVPFLQFRSNTILQYTQCQYDSPSARNWQDKLTANLKLQETYTGLLCPGAKKRLTKVVELMCQLTKKRIILNTVTKKYQPFQVGFLTLTIYSPDRNISGKEAHKTCLEPFLQWLRRVHKVKMYIWKAELQEREQIHYHLTIDQFVDKDKLQAEWNRLQIKAGYIDMDQYYSKFRHRVVPSIKIHAVHRKKSLSGYMCKVIANECIARYDEAKSIVGEVVKDIQNKLTIGGKVWDCSMNLKSGSYFVTLADTDYCNRIYGMMQRKEIKAVYTDHCVIFKFYKTATDTVMSPMDKKLFEDHRRNIVDMDMTLIRRESKKETELIDLQPPKRINFVPIPDLFSSS